MHNYDKGQLWPRNNNISEKGFALPSKSDEPVLIYFQKEERNYYFWAAEWTADMEQNEQPGLFCLCAEALNFKDGDSTIGLKHFGNCCNEAVNSFATNFNNGESATLNFSSFECSEGLNNKHHSLVAIILFKQELEATPPVLIPVAPYILPFHKERNILQLIYDMIVQLYKIDILKV